MHLKREADAYLIDCFTRESAPHVNELAAVLGFDRVAFTRRFRKQTGILASVYLKQAQIARAMELLRTTDLPTHTVAYAAAFGTRITFFRAFRRATGVTPDRYRSACTEGRNKT